MPPPNLKCTRCCFRFPGQTAAGEFSGRGISGVIPNYRSARRKKLNSPSENSDEEDGTPLHQTRGLAHC